MPQDPEETREAGRIAEGAGPARLADRDQAQPRTLPVPGEDIAGLMAPELERPAPPERLPEPRLPSAARAPGPTPHAAFLSCKHFGSLDGLRAIGILVVVWHHTVGGPGRFGANLFFLLSGFLVTTILMRERARKGSLDLVRFRTRRARRLYPLYFAVLAAYTGLVWLVEPAGVARTAFFEHLPAFATFTSNLLVGLDGEHVIFYFAWSLAAQEQFYLWWPLYLRNLSPRTCAGAVTSLVVTAYATRAGWLDLALPQGSWTRALVLSLMPALCLGALLGLGLQQERVYAATRRALGHRGTPVVLLALGLVLWRLPACPEPVMHLVLVALAAACVVREDHWLAPLLRHRALVHVGTVSYGVYLLHMLCHNASERVLARLGAPVAWLDFALTALLAVGLATVSHRHFENRFLPADKRRPA